MSVTLLDVIQKSGSISIVFFRFVGFSHELITLINLKTSMTNPEIDQQIVALCSNSYNEKLVLPFLNRKDLLSLKGLITLDPNDVFPAHLLVSNCMSPAANLFKVNQKTK